jgi:conjugal transfer pilin signal peptidase TrbI
VLPPARRESNDALTNTTIAFWLAAVILVGLLWVKFRVGVDGAENLCLPWRLYGIVLGSRPEIHRKDLIVFSSRGESHINDGLWLVKYAAAVPGDTVRVDATGIYINGTRWGPLNERVLRSASLSVSDVSVQYVVPDGKFVALGTLPLSYDSRYWGPVDMTSVRGRAFPIW